MKVVKKLDMMDQVLFYCNSVNKVQEVFQFDREAHAYPWHSYYAALDSGAILTTNMLKGGTYTDLLATYPATRVIQSDISDQLIPKLKKQ